MLSTFCTNCFGWGCFHRSNWKAKQSKVIKRASDVGSVRYSAITPTHPGMLVAVCSKCEGKGVIPIPPSELCSV